MVQCKLNIRRNSSDAGVRLWNGMKSTLFLIDFHGAATYGPANGPGCGSILPRFEPDGERDTPAGGVSLFLHGARGLRAPWARDR
jgi:hypothetical protein